MTSKGIQIPKTFYFSLVNQMLMNTALLLLEKDGSWVIGDSAIKTQIYGSVSIKIKINK
jgi:hypothetical protein